MGNMKSVRISKYSNRGFKGLGPPYPGEPSGKIVIPNWGTFIELHGIHCKPVGMDRTQNEDP